MSLSIAAEWERLDRGPPEEQACFAAIGIFAGHISLTEAEDTVVKRLRSSVHLSAYRLAEWLAWNWWRQRWEPRSDAADWPMAHRMTTVGGGYIWPNITLASDGERMALIARPTELRPAEPLRYIANIASIHPAVEFEDAVAVFVSQVQGQLRAESIAQTNLDQIWDDLREEWADPAATARRRLEAQLGFDPGEADIPILNRLVAEMADLGESGVGELASMSSGRNDVPTARHLQEIANEFGADVRLTDAVGLRGKAELPAMGLVPAWLRGAKAAQKLRAQEQLGNEPIMNERLTELAGVSSGIIDHINSDGIADIPFELDRSDSGGRIVLRSKWVTGRRFELARLMGDRIAGDVQEPLLLATRTATYRQKLQRAFAAELLCPFEALEDMLGGDYGDDRQEEAAEHFNVSPFTVRTLLVNHGRLGPDDLETEFGAAAAA